MKRVEVEKAPAIEWLRAVLGDHGIKITDDGRHEIRWSSPKSLTPKSPGKVYSDYVLEVHVLGVDDPDTIDSVMRTFREKYGGRNQHAIVARFYNDKEQSVLVREFEIVP